MKSFLCVLVALLGFCLPAKAQTTQATQPVKVSVPFVTDCSTVSFTTTAVDVTGNTTVASTTYAAFAVKVTNTGATNNICCSQSSGVTCSTGETIAASATAPYNWLSWGVSVTQKWYCASSASTTIGLVCRSK